MSGRQKTYQTELTETESQQLQQLVTARKSSQAEAKRARTYAEAKGLLGVIRESLSINT